MYSFLDFVSELLERYSWTIVPSLIGALAIALIWSKVPKTKIHFAKKQNIATQGDTRKIIKNIIGLISVSLLLSGLIIQVLFIEPIGKGLYALGALIFVFCTIWNR